MNGKKYMLRVMANETIKPPKVVIAHWKHKKGTGYLNLAKVLPPSGYPFGEKKSSGKIKGDRLLNLVKGYRLHAK